MYTFRNMCLRDVSKQFSFQAGTTAVYSQMHIHTSVYRISIVEIVYTLWNTYTYVHEYTPALLLYIDNTNSK